MPQDIRIEFYHRPGRTLPELACARLVEQLRRVGAACFPELPDYQCFQGTGSLDDKVITVARDIEGRVVGFCSAILLDVPGVPAVMHLGLTCVHPDARGKRLTHRLTSALTVKYMMRYRPFGRVWITNVACVLSSIGNVALSFDDVYPSPFATAPSVTHLRIARTISEQYREAIYIDADAAFDPEHFVFRGSVGGTVFQKRADDTRYHHREKNLNLFYTGLLDFNRGDEIVQVGNYSLATFGRYVASGFGKRRRLVPPPPAWMKARGDDHLRPAA